MIQAKEKMMTKKYTKASLRDRIAINDILKDYCTVIGDGMAAYTPEWDDARVAETVGGHITKSMVGGVRREMFGHLQPSHTSATAPAFEKRLAALEEAVRILQAHAGTDGTVTHLRDPRENNDPGTYE